MPFFAWSPLYSVGVAKIDAQHKRLSEILTRLYNGVWEGNKSLARAFNEFRDYAVEHFATEEKLMELHGYPDLPAHKKEHAGCMARVVDYQAALKHGERVDPIEVCRFFQKWLEDHIAGEDRKYAPFFKARGVK
jgi:hemerythrin-like metal-binding protein